MIKKKVIPFLILIYLFSIPLKAQEVNRSIDQYINNLVINKEIQLHDSNWIISSQHISSVSGINHIYFKQSLNNIPINNTTSSIHLLANGKMINDNNSFIKNTSRKYSGSSTPTISAIKAVELAANQLGYSVTKPFKIISENKNTESIISADEISMNEIPVKLMYYLNKDDRLVLVWNLLILEQNYNNWWLINIDANTGLIIDKKNNILNCTAKNQNKLPLNKFKNHNTSSNIPNLNKKNTTVLDCENCYEVFKLPIESPYFGEQSIVYNPADLSASPMGWHSLNSTKTKGNNIRAFIGNSDNYNYSPNGGVLFDFTGYQFNQDFTEENRFEDASITNLFYWGNIIHDITYTYGFDENAGNFQLDNFDNEGLGNDSLRILGQFELNVCSAAMAVTSDGTSPFIHVNTCGDKDGGFDNLVLVHEYIHGVSTRLTGGGLSYCLDNEEQMGEGWSDWYALMFTMTSANTGSNPRGIATYLLDEGPNGNGVRSYPYTTNLQLNPLTYNDISFASSVHKVGEIWASILWELTWLLIEEFGFDENIYNFTGDLNQDAGNIIALAIVTEGMKLQPCRPGFIDGRDAILMAYKNIYGQEHDCLLWEAFAKRGLGFYASQGSPEYLNDGIESFEVPPLEADFNATIQNVCFSNTTTIEGGFPLGGVYSGLGVIDDGNGKSFSFNPQITGIGPQTIFYEVPNSICSFQSIDSDTIEVKAPEISCIESVTVTIASNENQYSLEDLTPTVTVNDTCDNIIQINQLPSEGTLFDIGESLIEFEIIDGAGNSSNCSLILIVKKDALENEETVALSPNPSNREITLSSTTLLVALNIDIFDIHGRLILTKEFADFGFEKTLNIETIAAGVYFVKIKTSGKEFAKRLVKY